MKNQYGNLAVSAAALAALSLMATVPATAPAKAADYYEGKTLTLLVGFGAGSGNTTQAHLFARHLPKFIAGQPNVIVKNMPGGGTTKAKIFCIKKESRTG